MALKQSGTARKASKSVQGRTFLVSLTHVTPGAQLWDVLGDADPNPKAARLSCSQLSGLWFLSEAVTTPVQTSAVRLPSLGRAETACCLPGRVL